MYMDKFGDSKESRVTHRLGLRKQWEDCSHFGLLSRRRGSSQTKTRQPAYLIILLETRNRNKLITKSTSKECRSIVTDQRRNALHLHAFKNSLALHTICTLKTLIILASKSVNLEVFKHCSGDRSQSLLDHQLGLERYGVMQYKYSALPYPLPVRLSHHQQLTRILEPGLWIWVSSWWVQKSSSPR